MWQGNATTPKKSRLQRDAENSEEKRARRESKERNGYSLIQEKTNECNERKEGPEN
jgi:hypothetical protein